MNKVELLGRLTRNPEMKNVGGSGDTPMARYTLAVDRRYRAAGADADFIPCVVFGKGAEFAMKYLKKGAQIVVCGRITSGSYTDGDGKKVYTMNVVVDEHYFAGGRTEGSKEANADSEGFMSVPDGEGYRLSKTLEQSVRAHLYTLQVCASCGAYFSNR